jgi:hypothetical protein
VGTGWLLKSVPQKISHPKEDSEEREGRKKRGKGREERRGGGGGVGRVEERKRERIWEIGRKNG